MKYEVTGDTIIIKYIADGKYKQLELNKNDNIDLDFFGQLIKAKNNKQDAMCDLYAKEVLSYEPAAERISNMSLSKPDEPSEYIKKESAKLRIEELNRDLKLVEKEIENTLAPMYKHKTPEELKDIELTDDYLSNRGDNVNRLKELLSKYNSIKKMIEKEQKTYDDNTKNNLSQDQLINKITKEFESKINKVVKTSEVQKEAVEFLKDSLKPTQTIQDELTNTIEIITELKKLFNQQDVNDSSIEDDDEYLDIESIYEKLNLLTEHIKIIINLLRKTTIDNNITQTLIGFMQNLDDINKENIDENLIEDLDNLYEILNEIKTMNEKNEIGYTETTQKQIVKATNKLLSENERLQFLYEQPLGSDFINEFIENIPHSLLKQKNQTSFAIKVNPRINLTDEDLQTILNNSPYILIWYDDNTDFIHSNKPLFDVFEQDNETKIIRTKTIELTCQSYKISKSEFQNKKFKLFRNYLTTDQTDFKLPIQSIDLYLNLEKRDTKRTINTNEKEIPVEYNGYNLTKTPMSSFIDIVSGYGQGINSNSNKEMYSGKIDLDKASTEDKLSEIVRLLQNIGYNLFTLTPNYEENEKNKRLKSKGIDLQEYFKNKSD